MLSRVRLPVCFFLLVAAGGAASPEADPEQPPLVQALEAELERGLAVYGEEDPPCYYLQYEVLEHQSTEMQASYGAIMQDDTAHWRSLSVDLRVGSPELDHTHPIRGQRGGSVSLARPVTVQIPLEDDEAALRAAAWDATNQAFRMAQEAFIQVQANREIRIEESDPSPDFSSSEPVTATDRVEHPGLDEDAWRGRLARISALFKDHEAILDSAVNLQVRTQNRVLVNSEGSRIATGDTRSHVYVQAAALADDGMALSRHRSHRAVDPSGLPSDEELDETARGVITELEALRHAPLVEPYSGPAVLKGLAAAVFFHEVVGHRVEGHRQKREEEGQTFTDKIGERVLPAFLSIHDDPTVAEIDGVPLSGHYRYDDEGVPAARVTIVQDGVFEGFLLSRSPIEGFPESNGHGRRAWGQAPVARQGTLIAHSEKTMSADRLHDRFLEELEKRGKPYGLVFEEVSGGAASTRRAGPQAFQVQPLLVRKVYADGRPSELVRGVDIVGTPLAVLENILAAGDDPAVFNGTCGAESGPVPVSAVSPSLLVSDIEVEKSPRQQNRPPLLPPPLHDPGPDTKAQTRPGGGS